MSQRIEDRADEVADHRAVCKQEVEQLVSAEHIADFREKFVESIVCKGEFIAVIELLRIECSEPRVAFVGSVIINSSVGAVRDNLRAIHVVFFEFLVGDILVDVDRCAVIVFEDFEHVFNAEHPTVGKQSVAVVNTFAVNTVRDDAFHVFKVVVGGIQIFGIPEIILVARKIRVLNANIVAVHHAVDFELAVRRRSEFNDLLGFLAVSVIRRIRIPISVALDNVVGDGIAD